MKKPITRVSLALSWSSLATLLMASSAMGLGGCMLSVQADVPDVEVTQHDLAFEGIPNGSLLGELSMGTSFTREWPALKLPEALDSSVQAVKVELSARTGIPNFQFLRSLRITMSPKDSTTAPVELMSYEKVDGSAVGATLTVPSKNPVNILDQWMAKSAIFNVQIAGTLPEQSWSVDMSIHFAGQISYKF